MNSLDIAFLFIVGVSVVMGLWKGLVREIFSIVGVLVGILVAILVSPRLAPELERWIEYETAAYAAAFLLLFFGTLIAATVLGQVLNKVVSFAQLGMMNRLLGGFFGFVRGAVVAIIALVGLTLFLEPEAPLLAESRLTPRLAWGARVLSGLLPEGPRATLLERLEGLPEEGPEVRTI